MRSTVRHLAARLGRRRESGMVMYVALVVLIIMTLAGVAMMRQMGSSVSVAGNVAFKKNATSVADHGVEAARAWYTSTTLPPNLNTSSQANGYYASWGGVQPDGTTEPYGDPSQMDWSSGGWNVLVVSAANDPTGNEIRYVLQRLCKTSGLPPAAAGQQCSDSGVNQASDKGGAGGPGGTPPPNPYYRVTVRVQGPRNTISYVQVIMN